MRILLAPRMLILHAVVVAVVVMLVNLGLWQVSRLGVATERTDRTIARLNAAPVEATTLLDGRTLDDEDALADLEFRRVSALGVWRPADEVLQRGRSHEGRSGFHVLTPLDLADGTTLVVRRGWVPFDNDLLPPVTDAAPTPGDVHVTGYLERSIPQPTGPIAQRDPEDGLLPIVFNADLGRLGPQLGTSVRPMLLHLEGQVPVPTTDLPIPAPRPELDNGPHLSYAIQWFSFAAIAVGMYILWLRRRLAGDERALSPAARTDNP